MILAILALAWGQDEPAALPLPDPRPGRGRFTGPAPRYGTTGFRTAVPAADTSASTRVAFVQDFDGATIGELTLRGMYASQSFGLAIEVAGTAAVSDRWSGIGLGNTVVDVRGLFGRAATHAFGIRGALPTGFREGPHGELAWWGTVPQATVPMWGIALAYTGATERWAWHTHVGIRTGEGWGYSGLSGMIDAVTSLATIQPVAPRWDIVAEVELLSGPSPLHIRALARHDFGHGWEGDVGLAVPLVVFVQEPTLQVLGRVERRW
ncbi:MAG: hypothetical protein V4850_21230 [Myxococcota bacterium]